MASSKDRERKLARAKIDRQRARRADQVRSQRQIQARIGAVLAILLVAAGVGWATHWYGITKPKPIVAAQCTWTPADTAANTSLKNVGKPPTSGITMTGQQTMTITTDQGVIPVELNVTQAPCTAASFSYLASKKFFDNTKCHRLTTAGIYVLQCGDPSGSGSGGPSYTIQDENIPLTDQPAPGASTNPSAPAVSSVIYKAGTIAMALTSGSDGSAVANSGSSQFFLVYKDSPLPASYPEIGTIDPSGLTVLNKIAAGGVDPSSSNANDGPPKIATTIETLTVGKVRALPAVTPTPAPLPSVKPTPSPSVSSKS